MTTVTRRRAGAGNPRPGLRGFSLAEMLMGMALLSLAVTLSVPPAVNWARRQRLEGAIRNLALEMAAARWSALATGAATGLAFAAGGGQAGWLVVRDGDGDGLRRADLDAAVDLVVGPPRRLPSGVRFGILGGAMVPRLPPQKGTLDRPEDPVKFGSSDMATFSPLGTATAGSLYLHDGTDMAALVVHGVTGRLRMFRFDSEQHIWKEIT